MKGPSCSSYSTDKAKKCYTKKPAKIEASSIEIMSDSLSVSGSVYCGKHSFSCGHSVPVYEITTIHALNQLIGYAKFINRSYGDVYYRGECKIHNSLMPSLFRNCSVTTPAKLLNDLINTIILDEKMQNQLKFDGFDKVSKKAVIEGLLQHYGIKTRFLDVVDNHWVALWMGLNKNVTYKQIETYYHYIPRSIPIGDVVASTSVTADNLYQYVLLLAVPGDSERINNGIYFSSDYLEIDLRQALPSTFLRPHAQHGLVICKRPHVGGIEDYDLADSVVGILKMRIDYVAQWIGHGNLLTQENLFPAPAYDHGYDILLSRKDIFNGNNRIAMYI